MVTVKVLGMGCKKCENLEQKVKEVAAANNIEANIIKISDLQQIMQYKVMMTPGLVVNEVVKCAGIIPKDDQLITWLREG